MTTEKKRPGLTQAVGAQYKAREERAAERRAEEVKLHRDPHISRIDQLRERTDANPELFDLLDPVTQRRIKFRRASLKQRELDAAAADTDTDEK